MSPFEYKSGSDGVTMVIVSVIRLTPRVSGLCQSGRRVATSALWRGGDPKYSRGGGGDGWGGLNSQEVRTCECTAVRYNGPWCNDIFVPCPFPLSLRDSW